MNVNYILKYGDKAPEEAKPIAGQPFLNISEFFYGTIQGEGIYVGQPAAFLRLAGCPVDCKFCDTAEVWKTHQKVSIDWLLKEINGNYLYPMFEQGMHLVVTGGSPLLQQKNLIVLLSAIKSQGEVFVEIENECSFKPDVNLYRQVGCWNNSPKLSNAGVPEEVRYKPEIILFMSYLQNSWFKFVVRDEYDIQEILDKYLKPGYINREQVILMPMGATREEYNENREGVVELAVKYGFRYSPREHIAIWDKKTGI